MDLRCGNCGLIFDIEDDEARGTLRCPRCERGIPLRFIDPEAEYDPILGEDDALDDVAELEEGFAEQARLAMTQVRKITVACGACGKHLSVGPRLAGKTARCPACKQPIRIPWPDEEENFALEALAAAAEDEDEHLDLMEIDAEQFPAVPETAAVPMAAPVRSHWGYRIMIAAMILIGLGLVVLVPVLLWPTDDEPDPADGEGDSSDATARLGTPDGPDGAGGGVEPNRAPTQPVVRPASVFVEQTLPVVLGPGGRRPAPPQQWYWRVRLNIAAGSEPVRLRTGDIRLRGDGQTWTALGRWAEPTGPLAPVARPHALTLRPDERAELLLVFRAPLPAGPALLEVGDLRELQLGQLSPPQVTLGPAGSYAEKPPRNLQPMLEGPIAAAIQQTPRQRLIIRPSGEGWEVSLPRAQITGRARRLSDELYGLVLKRGDAVRDAKLRLIDDGRAAVLYLADRPWRQITFQRR